MVTRREGVKGLLIFLLLFVLTVAGGATGAYVAIVLSRILSLHQQIPVNILRGSAIALGGFAAFLGTWALLPNWHRPNTAERHTLYRTALLLPAVIVLSRQRMVWLPIWHAIFLSMLWSLAFLFVTRHVVDWKQSVQRKQT